ncbi:hypothetical protein BZL30_9107 [Mycobacterium kansasii]|uniref:Uncharacterized protein n=1 Tax=Mycobacterium kansasii TaxID=1768 RepID=A0A1V3WC20_MYCKA|nr:hypothetical protein BZL30_9107 [Mycobacterium kansasii]
MELVGFVGGAGGAGYLNGRVGRRRIAVAVLDPRMPQVR